MAELRAYRRSDLPGLAEVWNECYAGGPNFVRVGEAGLRARVTDQPSFDPERLLVAANGEHILGFVHFGPRTSFWFRRADRSVDPTEGQIYVVVTRGPDPPLARDLLATAVARLAQAGARRALLGPSWVYGTQPFYNGIAGAYEFPGLTAERPELLDLAAEAGFSPLAEYATPELDLSDQEHLAALRAEAVALWRRARDWGLRQRPRPLISPFFPDRDSVELLRGSEIVATAAYGLWEEYARAYGRRLFGITSVQVAQHWRGRGLGKLIVIGAMEAAIEARAEALHLHVWRDNQVAWNLYHRALGFQPKHTWVTLARSLST